MLNRRRVLALLVSALLVCSLPTAWAAAEPLKEPVPFSIIWGNWQTWDEPMSADPVGRWITEQTGVTLDMELITGDMNEKYSLMLATGEYPDFMEFSDGPMGRYVAEGALVPLEEHLDKLPNVVSKYGEFNLNALKNLDDGHLYHLPTWFMGKAVTVDRGMNIRHDLMEQYFPDRANVKSTILLSELEEAFKAYKAEHPVTEDGLPVYPLTDFGSAGQENGLSLVGRQMFGITPYFETSDQGVLPSYFHPNYVELVKWANRWYREGLLDPEFAINKEENAQNKVANGSALAVLAHESQITQANTALMANNPEQYLMSYYRVADRAGEDAYMSYSALGSGGLSITKNCKDLDKALEFIDFMNRPLTNFVCANGVEGGIWEFDEDGTVRLLTDKIAATPELWDRFREYGAYKYIFMLCEGPDERFTGYEGNTYAPVHGLDGGYSQTQVGRYAFWEDANLIDPSLYTGIEPVAGTDESIIKTAIQDIWLYSFPQMVMAPSEEEAVARYEEALEQVRAQGLDQLCDVVGEKYFKKKALLFPEG